MSGVVTNILAVGLVVLGVWAEFNLLRALVQEWRESRREERARILRETARAGEHQAPVFGRSIAQVTRVRFAACLALPVLLSAAAHGQEPAPSWNDSREDSGVMTIAPAALSFAQQTPLAAAQEAGAAEKEEPLTISANRPGFDDTTSIVPLHHVQLETGYTFTFRHREGVETQTNDGPEALFRVPLVDDRLELQVGWTGYIYSRSDSGSGFTAVDGVSDMTVGLRLKVADEDGWIPRLCLQGSTTLGLGSNDVSNQDIEPTLKLIWSYDLGKGWSLYGNVGVGYATSGSDHFIQGQGGVCVGYAINDRWAVFGEYYMYGPNSKGTDAAHSIDGGAAYLITTRIQVDARVGLGLNAEANTVFTGAGISFLF